VIILINGPLGIGKSTLAEALCESIEGCVMLDGDRLLVKHHRRHGYRHFVIDHFWGSAADIEDLRRRLEPLDADLRCFLLTLPSAENHRRIERRASVRALDERGFEREAVARERRAIAAAPENSLGEPFDASAPPSELVERMLGRLRGS
jgi:hypothetical protein